MTRGSPFRLSVDSLPCAFGRDRCSSITVARQPIANRSPKEGSVLVSAAWEGADTEKTRKVENRSQSCLRSLARRAATRGAAARQAQWMCQHVRKAHRTPSSGGLSSTVHLRRRYGVRTAARPLALAWRSRSSVSSWTTPHRHGVPPAVCRPSRVCAHSTPAIA